jgi:hypothetical protein
MDKSHETAIAGAAHGGDGSISDGDSVVQRAEKNPDSQPRSGDAVTVEEDERTYPPTSQAVLIVSSLVASMFLVALVCNPTTFNCCC